VRVRYDVFLGGALREVALCVEEALDTLVTSRV